jgi:hypothetical protein
MMGCDQQLRWDCQTASPASASASLAAAGPTTVSRYLFNLVKAQMHREATLLTSGVASSDCCKWDSSLCRQCQKCTRKLGAFQILLKAPLSRRPVVFRSSRGMLAGDLRAWDNAARPLVQTSPVGRSLTG